MAKNANNLYNRAFRQKIINLDKGSLGELVGALAGDVEVKVLENTKETYYVAFPVDTNTVDLSGLGDIQAAGGTSTFGSVCSTLSTIGGFFKGS